MIVRIVLFVMVVLFVVAAADVARAHHDSGAVPSWGEWEPKRSLPSSADVTLHDQAAWITPEPAVMEQPPAHTPATGVEQWRGMVADRFPEWAVTDALSVMSCESMGNPDAKNPVSSAAGLFQFIRSTWDWVAPNVGAGSYDSGAVYDPAASIDAAHWLWSVTGGWLHWVCQP